ncbi:MAG: hypothetical protein MI754_16640 [Chromatiales bacterium]|nr:hypothetical protein [Chromatiales bacterium]
MKKIVYTLLMVLPLSVSAQSTGQQPERPPFATVKSNMLPIIDDSIGPMSETRDCVAKSQNSEQLNVCVEMMTKHQEKMMTRMAKPGHTPPPQPEAPVLEWSEELKKQILVDMDKSIATAKKTKVCLQSSSSHEQMIRCMGAVRPKAAK